MSKPLKHPRIEQGKDKPDLVHVTISCPPEEHWLRVEGFFYAATGELPLGSLSDVSYDFEGYMTQKNVDRLHDYVAELQKSENLILEPVKGKR